MEFLEGIITSAAPGVAGIAIVAYMACKFIDRTCASFEAALDRRDNDITRIVDAIQDLQVCQNH